MTQKSLFEKVEVTEMKESEDKIKRNIEFGSKKIKIHTKELKHEDPYKN